MTGFAGVAGADHFDDEGDEMTFDYVLGTEAEDPLLLGPLTCQGPNPTPLWGPVFGGHETVPVVTGGVCMHLDPGDYRWTATDADGEPVRFEYGVGGAYTTCVDSAHAVGNVTFTTTEDCHSVGLNVDESATTRGAIAIERIG